MTEKKSNSSELTADVMLADAMLRLTALERVLLQKGIITQEELTQMTEMLVSKITKVVMDRLQSSKNLDDFISALGSDLKKDFNN